MDNMADEKTAAAMMAAMTADMPPLKPDETDESQPSKPDRADKSLQQTPDKVDEAPSPKPDNTAKPSSQKPAISIKDLYKTFVIGKEKVRALAGVSLDIYPNEIGVPFRYFRFR